MLFENLTNQDYYYNNESLLNHETIKRKNHNLLKKLNIIKNTFPKSEYIFPADYIFEFIDYSFQIFDLYDQTNKHMKKIEELTTLRNNYYIELKHLENETLNNNSKKKNIAKYIQLSLSLLEKVIN